jgi:hypothetical protein
MKPNLTFNSHYIVFLSLALLLTPGTMFRPCNNLLEKKVEHSQHSTAEKSSEELLHSEMLFRY